jgi:glycerophosphoryl diester phosphodiesterase
LPTVAVHAHRGSPDPATGVGENTLQAFERARQLGADGVELDVRLTADGSMAVCHDAVIPGLGPVAEAVTAELPGHVPLLPAALDACRSLTVNIEIKNLPGEPGFDPEEHLARRVADLVGETGRTTSVIVSSFWTGTLQALHEHRPDVPTGFLVTGWPDPAASVAAAAGFGCRAVHPHVTMLTTGLVEEAHEAGLAVATWTVNNRATLLLARSARVDTVITDDVALARNVFAGSRPGEPGRADDKRPGPV